MKLESLKLKNFRTFKEAILSKIPPFCILVGANGTGKSTIFEVFEFLKNAMESNVNVALYKLGGGRGFLEVRTRNSEGPVEIELKFREQPGRPLATYTLAINERNGRAFIERETLKYRRGRKGQPWHFLDFSNGEGEAVTNESVDTIQSEAELTRAYQKLRSNDILAIKGLSQFQEFPAALALGSMIEHWHISDFHINKARGEQEANHAAHLSREGENLSLVVQYLYNYHRDAFDRIIEALKHRVPGVVDVLAKTTDEGRILLKFKDGAFEEPFLAKFVSDGTIKRLAYLILLYDPEPFPLLCVEEPENQLYHELLGELAEEFRSYSQRGGQVVVSTHSPDFLNQAELDEVFWLEKRNGCTSIHRAADDPQLAAYMSNGDQMGCFWRQGFFRGVSPE